MELYMNASGSYWNSNSYTVYESYDFQSNDKVVYSDRLYQWDNKKYKDAAIKAFNGYRGQYFNDFTPNQIQKFLSIYFNKEVILTKVIKEENVSNGYPYWVFFYRDKEI